MLSRRWIWKDDTNTLEPVRYSTELLLWQTMSVCVACVADTCLSKIGHVIKGMLKEFQLRHPSFCCLAFLSPVLLVPRRYYLFKLLYKYGV